MLLPNVTYIRRGRHIYRRAGHSDNFRLEMTYASATKAKKFQQDQPVGTAIRYEWVVGRLGDNNIKLME